MTVRSLESVHQLRYFGITHMDNPGLPLLMPMIHVHLVMVVTPGIYTSARARSRSLEFMHDVNSSCTPLPRCTVHVHLYCSAWLSRLYIVDLATPLYIFIYILFVSSCMCMTIAVKLVENP